MFVRIYRNREEKELLINTALVWKIEVEYGVTDGSRIFGTSLDEGATNPETIRVYRIFVGSEVVLLPGDDPVAWVFERIYRNAVKGAEPGDAT